MTNARFYVYGLISPRNNQYIYIGKGHGNRMYRHINIEDISLYNGTPTELEIEYKRKCIQNISNSARASWKQGRTRSKKIICLTN